MILPSVDIRKMNAVGHADQAPLGIPPLSSEGISSSVHPLGSHPLTKRQSYQSHALQLGQPPRSRLNPTPLRTRSRRGRELLLPRVLNLERAPRDDSRGRVAAEKTKANFPICLGGPIRASELFSEMKTIQGTQESVLFCNEMRVRGF